MSAAKQGLDRARTVGGRAPWGSITRDQIVTAALAAVQPPGGFEAMTIRGLATGLGVAPMSLYRHVRDKDDLLDEVVDRLLADVWKPTRTEANWKAWVADAADRFRRFLVTQPAALHVYLQHPVVSPVAVTRMEAVLQVLRRGLGTEAAARRAYAAVQTYTLGFAALEASRAGWPPADRAPADGAGGARADRGSRRRAGPVALAEQLAAYTTPRQFSDGLRYLLDGIAADHGPGRGRRRGPGQ